MYTRILKLKELGFITLICIYLRNLNVNKFQKVNIVITHGFFLSNDFFFWKKKRNPNLHDEHCTLYSMSFEKDPLEKQVITFIHWFKSYTT